jgi:hypothetical protein
MRTLHCHKQLGCDYPLTLHHVNIEQYHTISQKNGIVSFTITKTFKLTSFYLITFLHCASCVYLSDVMNLFLGL